MNRLIMVLVAFALVVAACSSASADESAGSGTVRSPAEDFTLALEPSGEFVLSQEVKPVFMVFWAEW